MRSALFLIFAAWVGVAHCQQAAVSQDWLDNLREERTTIVSLLAVRAALFVPNLLGLPVPVSRDNLEKALLLNGFDPASPIDSEEAMRQLLTFDRGYRQKLKERLAEIDRELQAGGTPAAPPQTQAAPLVPVGGSLFGDDAGSRGLGFDQYIEETRREATSGSTTGGALQLVAGGATLFGQALCTFTVELIITAGTEVVDRDPASPSRGRSVLMVPASAESGFHVQLYHPATGKARLSGRDARIALEQKGYLVATGNGWRGTQAYEDFVNYGAGYQRGATACSAPSVPAAAGTLRVTANGSVIRGGDRYANVAVKWMIDNPTGKPIRFTKMTRTQWVMQRDGSGRFTGGRWETDTQRGFTLPSGRSEKQAYPWLPCNGKGNANGTYREVYEGSDADGNPVTLELEFNGGEAKWP